MGWFGKPDTEPDVIVHHAKGCELDGRTDKHKHTQSQHRAHVDQVGARMREQGWGKHR